MKPPSLTIGIEEEYQIIDPATGELRSYITQILDEGQLVLKEQIKAELTIRNLVEALVTPVARSGQLVTKARDGVGPPLFLCHGDYDGWGFYARRLADRLEHCGPVYLLHPNYDAARGLSTMQAMASTQTCQVSTRPAGEVMPR